MTTLWSDEQLRQQFCPNGLDDDLPAKVALHYLTLVRDSYQVELNSDQQRIAALEAELAVVREWLDSQPPMPQPDWRDCPGYATHHAFRPNGKGYWVRLPEQKYASLRRPVTAEDVDWWDEECDESGLTLPLGIDWRQTLRQRPQEPQP